jgi:CRISPR-associated protein Csm5
MPVYIEVIPHDIAFTTELSLAENSFAKAPTHKKLPDTMSDIRTACNNFYGDILAHEQSYINQPALYTKLKQASQKPNAFIIRIGKHSGAESVTIDGLRRIQNRKCPNYFMDHSTTYWLAENGRENLPFGWCVVEYDEVK